MKSISPQPLLKYVEEIEEEESKEEPESVAEKEPVGEEEEDAEKESEEGNEDEDEVVFHDAENGKMEAIIERMQSIVLHNHKPDCTKRGEEPPGQKNGQWREEQKTRAAQLEEQLKAKWVIEELIEEQLDRYHAHYNRALVPTRPKDVAQILMANWVPPDELACLSWFGDWRPSAILELLRTLTRCSSPSSPFSAALSDSDAVEHVLSQMIHEMRIEETVVDEEMAEIQATCIFHLPFGPTWPHGSSRSGPRPTVQTLMSNVLLEFKKMERVIAKAQQLRSKTLEMVVNKVLSRTDAAEFLVAFAGVQDLIHQFASQKRSRKGPIITVPVAKGPK